MSQARAVVTGLGIVTPLGVGTDEFWSRLIEGSHELVRPRAREGVPAPALASVFEPEFAAEKHADRRILRKISNLSRATTVATAFCLEDAQLPAEALEDVGCVFGTTFGSSGYHLDYHERLRREGLEAGGALLFTQSVFNAPAGHACQVFGFHGPSLALVGGESVGLEAIQLASDRIRLESSTALLAGGGEESSDLALASARAMGLIGDALSDAGPAPFGEGACLVVLEHPDSAAARGVSAILGTGSVSAAGDDRLRRAATLALADAGLAAGAIDLVVTGATHGSSELLELDGFLGAANAAPVWTAPKTWLGEGFAATSAVLVAVACLARRRGAVPPTREPEATFPALSQRFRERVQERDSEYVLVVSSATPGSASAIVLGPRAPR